MLKPSTRIVIPSIGAVFSHRLRLPSAFGDWQVASLWAGFAPVPWSSSKHRSFSRFGMANSWRTQRVGSGENVQQTLVPDSWVRVNIAEPYHVPDIAELFGEIVELFNTFKCPKDNMFNLRSLNMRGPKTALRRPDQNFVCPRPDYRIMEILKLEKWSLR